MHVSSSRTEHPLRLLSIVTQLESGGAQTVAIELHREFIARGIPSKLLFLYQKDGNAFPQRDYQVVSTIRPKSIPAARILFRDLRDTWKAFNPTTVLCHTHFTNNLCGMMKRVTSLQGDIVAVHHNVFSSYPLLSQTIDRLAHKKLYDAEVSVSEPVRRSLPDGGIGLRHRTILNGQRLSLSTLDTKSARKSFGLPDHGFIIGNVGRLAEQKNQRFLIDLLARIPDAHVAVLGEGHLRDELTQHALTLGVANRLRLIGTVVHERVPDFLAALDMFAMPSLHEGMSIAMLEALAAGIPFIGSDVPTVAEVVRNREGKDAGIVLPLNLDQWMLAINGLRIDPAALAALSDRQRTRALDFSVAQMTDRYLAVATAMLKAGC